MLSTVPGPWSGRCGTGVWHEHMNMKIRPIGGLRFTQVARAVGQGG